MADQTSSAGADTTRASLELLYHISRELASDLDLQVVLRRVLLLSMEAVKSVSGSIIILDSHGEPIHSAIIHSGKLYNEDTKPLGQILKKGLAGWVAQKKKVVIISDTSKDPRWLIRPDDSPDQTGPKSAMSAPLMARDELVGIMTLVHNVPGTFTKEHGDLLQTIAEQSGITVLNARLYEEARRREKAMTALAESSMAITASLGTEDILQQVIKQVQGALTVKAVSLSLADPGNETVIIKAVTGNVSESILTKKTRLGEGISGLVAQTGKHMIVFDTAMDDRYNPKIAKYFDFEPQVIACVPIFAQEDVVGTIEIYNPAKGSFSKDDMVVLSGIGSMAGPVIRYAQLFERLQAAHRQYRELFDDSIDMILITDKEGNIRKSNRQAEAVILQTKTNKVATNIFDIHRAQYNEKADDLEQQRMISYEAEIETADGDRWFQVYLRKIQFEDENLMQWILHDISERKEMDALRDDLISMIYHDLRSPLANVLYSLDMIEMMMPENAGEELHPMIEVANRASERINRLTNALLDIRTLEAGQPLKNMQFVDADELLTSAYAAIKPIALAKSQVVSIETDNPGKTILVDKDMITRVLINLIENAVKYSPANGNITIRNCSDPVGIAFCVEDDGPGVPEDQWQNIFNKYSRLGNTGLGFGLGLSFCRLAVEAHGGKIWIEKTTKGIGTRFVFNLPVKETQPSETGYFRTQSVKS